MAHPNNHSNAQASGKQVISPVGVSYQEALKKLRPKDRKKLQGLVKKAVKTKGSAKMKGNLKKGQNI